MSIKNLWERRTVMVISYVVLNDWACKGKYQGSFWPFVGWRWAHEWMMRVLILIFWWLDESYMFTCLLCIYIIALIASCKNVTLFCVLSFLVIYIAKYLAQIDNLVNFREVSINSNRTVDHSIVVCMQHAKWWELRITKILWKWYLAWLYTTATIPYWPGQ